LGFILMLDNLKFLKFILLVLESWVVSLD
jgi:hypothetical protein